MKLEHLIHLNSEDVGMTEVGACALGDWLECNNSLQSLVINKNNINDDGLTKILNTIPSTLVRLIASDCNITCDGAKNIGETLKSIANVLERNKTLRRLDVSRNHIGDDKMSTLAHGM